MTHSRTAFQREKSDEKEEKSETASLFFEKMMRMMRQ